MSSKIIYILLLIGNCIISAISQILLKKAALKEYTSFISQYLNIDVIVAYALFFCVVILNTYILKFLPLTVVNSLSESLPYVFSIVSGGIFFSEKITLRKVIGTLFIISGILVVVV